MELEGSFPFRRETTTALTTVGRSSWRCVRPGGGRSPWAAPSGIAPPSGRSACCDQNRATVRIDWGPWGDEPPGVGGGAITNHLPAAAALDA
uniref:Uncharacterized protein n=1 Tax=Plectus sambesii TaxID=2011161 RepID=A0A914W9Q6_9BILA